MEEGKEGGMGWTRSGLAAPPTMVSLNPSQSSPPRAPTNPEEKERRFEDGRKARETRGRTRGVAGLFPLCPNLLLEPLCLPSSCGDLLLDVNGRHAA